MKVVVIGGGPAGMISAYFSASNGNQTTLIEKNEKLGKKLYITGKGRCNLTNDIEPDEFFTKIVNNAKFMFSSIRAFTPQDTMEFFEENHLRLKTERGNRVFPLSDKASDVTKCLENLLHKNNVEILLNEKVVDINCIDGKVVSVETDKQTIICDKVIVATGGVSYPSTGSTGDGYDFAKKLGHNIIDVKPALVGICISQSFCKDLQGLSLKNVSLKAYYNDKEVYNSFGEMLFTHFGISGPLVLSLSSVINRLSTSKLTFTIDLKPALTDSQLDKRILKDFAEEKGKMLGNSLNKLLPQRLSGVIIKESKIKAEKRNSEITKEERERLVKTIKNLTLKPISLRPIEEGIVTSGGVDVKDVNPKTMESKIIKGLYFAGEVLDIDAFTGGYNIQLALSTGAQAGKNI